MMKSADLLFVNTDHMLLFISVVLTRSGSRILGGVHFKKLRRAEGGAKIFGVFRVKNHHFTQKIHIFSNFRGERTGCAPPGSSPDLGVAVAESSSYPQHPASMKNLKTIVDNYNVFQVHYIV